MGKDGSQWKHGYIPENAAATALKMHRKPGGSKGSGGKKPTVKAKPKAQQHDLTTREGRATALQGVDISTPSGRALVMKVQRASLANAPVSYAAGTNAASARATLKAAKKATARKPTVKARASRSR